MLATCWLQAAPEWSRDVTMSRHGTHRHREKWRQSTQSFNCAGLNSRKPRVDMACRVYVDIFTCHISQSQSSITDDIGTNMYITLATVPMNISLVAFWNVRPFGNWDSPHVTHTYGLLRFYMHVCLLPQWNKTLGRTKLGVAGWPRLRIR